MPLPNPQHYTIEDIYSLPEGERAELIDGKLYMMAPPSYLHQTLCMELSATIRDYIRSHNGSCQVLPAPLAVNLQADDTTYVEPDISVVCDRSKITPKGINGAPDFIVEIVSPSSRKMDYITKNTLYSEAGVREYWIVDIAKNRITVYNFNHDYSIEEYSFTDTVKAGIYEDLSIDFSEINIL